MSDKQTSNVACVSCEGDAGGESRAWWRQPTMSALTVSSVLLVAGARRAVRNLRQNVVCSLVAIVVLVIAALTGQRSLTTGLLLNEGIGLLIIVNGLRLLAPVPCQRNLIQRSNSPLDTVYEYRV